MENLTNFLMVAFILLTSPIAMFFYTVGLAALFIHSLVILFPKGEDS